MNLILSLFICLLPQMEATSQTIQTGDWKKLTVEVCSVEHPADWTEDVSGDGGTTFFLYCPLDNPENFRGNINLLVQPLNGLGIDLQKFIEMTEEQIPTFLVDSQIIGKKTMKKSKREYCVLDYTGKLNGFDLHFLQYLWVIDEKAYTLTYTSHDLTNDVHLETAIKIMDSMKFNF